jgi:cytochrome c peroxidase
VIVVQRSTIVMAACLCAAGAGQVRVINDTREPVVRSVDEVAAIQFAPDVENIAGNRTRLAALIREAAGRGARIVVLPELALTGPLAGTSDAPEAVPGPTTEYFGNLSRSLRIWLSVSLAERARQGSYFITNVLMDEHGHMVQKIRKVMVRSNPGERSAARGDFRDILESVDAGGIRIGMLSGADVQAGMPRLANRGADTILISAAWSSEDPIQWTELARSLAKQYTVNLVVANRRDPRDRGSYQLGGVFSWLGGVMPPSSRSGDEVKVAPLGRRRLSWRSQSSRGLPSVVPVPLYEKGNEQIAELGRRLFFDPKLSSTGQVACSSCHAPERAFANGEAKGKGVYGRLSKRNVPTLLNVAFRPLLQWDGYASSLENFAKYPISNVHEMNSHYLDEVPAYLRAQEKYRAEFQRTMQVAHIEFEHAALALATYMRTLISGDSAFDRYYYGGDEKALTKEAKRGLRLFTGNGRCAACHLIEERSALFMDLKYHVTGVGYDAATNVFRDIGLAGISTAEQTGQFQTPSLRNVAGTAPYMHDGSMATLEQVIEFYDRGGNPNPRLDPLLKPLSLTVTEKRELAAFLRSLSGAERYTADGRRLKNDLYGATR